MSVTDNLISPPLPNLGKQFSSFKNLMDGCMGWGEGWGGDVQMGDGMDKPMVDSCLCLVETNTILKAIIHQLKINKLKTKNLMEILSLLKFLYGTSVLDILYKWNHVIFVLLVWLA